MAKNHTTIGCYIITRQLQRWRGFCFVGDDLHYTTSTTKPVGLLETALQLWFVYHQDATPDICHLPHHRRVQLNQVQQTALSREIELLRQAPAGLLYEAQENELDRYSFPYERTVTKTNPELLRYHMGASLYRELVNIEWRYRMAEEHGQGNIDTPQIAKQKALTTQAYCKPKTKNTTIKAVFHRKRSRAA